MIARRNNMRYNEKWNRARSVNAQLNDGVLPLQPVVVNRILPLYTS